MGPKGPFMGKVIVHTSWPQEEKLIVHTPGPQEEVIATPPGLRKKSASTPLCLREKASSPSPQTHPRASRTSVGTRWANGHRRSINNRQHIGQEFRKKHSTLVKP